MTLIANLYVILAYSFSRPVEKACLAFKLLLSFCSTPRTDTARMTDSYAQIHVRRPIDHRDSSYGLRLRPCSSGVRYGIEGAC
jgi:hypothetical protein